MKRRLIVLIGFICLSALAVSGCGAVTDEEGTGFNFFNLGQQEDPGPAINKDYMEDPSPYIQYGYERHTKEAAEDEEMPGYAVYDRPLLAEKISEMAAVIPDVTDAGVLVTGRHVLIAYESSSMDRDKTAGQVKQTAQAAVPSYYDVYVADNPQLMKDLERYKGHYSDNRAENSALEQMINDMKKYPQGASAENKQNMQ